jgi:hypothetical protein
MSGVSAGQLVLDIASFRTDVGLYILREMEVEAASENMRYPCTMAWKTVLASHPSLYPSNMSKYASAMEWIQTHGLGAYHPPESDVSEKRHKLARAILDPGSVVSAAFSEIFRSPLEKRRGEWRKSIGEAVLDLQKRFDVTFESLSTNDAFIDAVLQASAIAMRTSQKEKLDALRNAIMNAVLPDAPEHTLQQLFLGFVDQFTIWHLGVLVFLDEPTSWATHKSYTLPKYPNGTSIATLLTDVFTGLAKQTTLLTVIWNDLQTRCLVTAGDLDHAQSQTMLMGRGTTNLGREFVKFIGNPES